MGAIAGNTLASTLPWYVGVVKELWAKLCWLVVSGPTPSKARGDTGAVGTECLLPEVKGLEGKPGVCWLKSQGDVKEKTRRMVFHLPLLQTLPRKRSPGNYGLLQPVPTRTCWTPPAMGWAEDGMGLAEAESPELCQRLDVAGGDMTKALECASWVPAVFAVGTGLGRKDSPWIDF